MVFLNLHKRIRKGLSEDRVFRLRHEGSGGSHRKIGERIMQEEGTEWSKA